MLRGSRETAWREAVIIMSETDPKQSKGGASENDYPKKGVYRDKTGTWLTGTAAEKKYGIPNGALCSWRKRRCSFLDSRKIRWKWKRLPLPIRGRNKVGVYLDEDLKLIARRRPEKPKEDDPEPPSFVQEIVNLIAAGHTIRNACEIVGLQLQTFGKWKRYEKNKRIYQMLLGKAMEKSIRAVRTAAGTDAVLENPDDFLRRARAAEIWCNQRGRSLINSDGERTLRSFYHDYYEPVCLANVRERSKENFRQCIRRWAHITNDPPLAEITNVVMSRFKDALSKCRGKEPHMPISSTTVAKHIRHIQAIVDKAGPSGRGNRDAAGIIEKVPWVRPPKKHISPPRIIKPEFFDQVYTAAVGMEKPQLLGFKPAAWWRALIVLVYNTGLRKRTLFELRMTDIDWDKSRLVIPPQRMKSGRPHIMHLNETAKEHLMRIRTERERVFEWPFSDYHFFKMFHELQYIAGIPKKDHFGLHDIRKTLATAL